MGLGYQTSVPLGWVLLAPFPPGPPASLLKQGNPGALLAAAMLLRCFSPAGASTLKASRWPSTHQNQGQAPSADRARLCSTTSFTDPAGPAILNPSLPGHVGADPMAGMGEGEGREGAVPPVGSLTGESCAHLPEVRIGHVAGG